MTDNAENHADEITSEKSDRDVIVMPTLERTERKSGCAQWFGCIGKSLVVLALIAAPIALVWWWHPWHWESERVALEDNSCPEGHRGEKHVDYLVVLGVRVTESGSATICVPRDSGSLE